MVITSFVSTPLSVSAAQDTQINVSEIQYTAPAVAALPQPASVVIDQYHTDVKDRADNPAEMEAVDGSRAEIDQTGNVWGFCQQLKSTGNTAAKLNASRSVQILVSFRLYLNAYPTDGNVSILSKGDQYGVELTTNGLRLYLQNEQGQTRQVVYANCFTGGLHRWYDVAAVIDARNAGKSRIYVNGAASDMQAHRNINPTEDPFAIACKINGSAVSEKFTKDNGYLADLKFYNSSALSADDQETFRRSLNLNWMNNRADKGWSVIQDLLSSVKPTADFSLKPYDISTVWTTKESEDAEAVPVENDFQCGYPYTATTTLKAHDGFSFEGNTQDSVEVVDEYDYEKITLAEANGAADSQDTIGETGQTDRGAAKYAVDGNTSTYWHTRYDGREGGNNVNLANNENNCYTITLPEKTTVGKFEYLPRQAGAGVIVNGTIMRYNLYYKEANSADANWTILVEDGRWNNNSEKKSISFDPVEASQIRIEVKQASIGDYITAAEFEVYKAMPKTSATKTVTVSDDKKTLTITAAYSAIDCTATINYVAFPTAVTMEKDTPHTITSSVYASDSRPVSAHKGLSEQSKKIVYSYTVSEGDDVIDVNSTTGEITAKKVGTAVVTATAKLPAEDGSGETTLGTRDIQVTVLAENKKLQAPVITFKAPEEDAYPVIAEAGVQRTDLENQMLVDTVSGGATLDLVEGADAPAFECIDNITGFVARYKATMADQQFNVTGSNPMVITLKLYLNQLPTDNREHTILAKGNQYNLVVMKESNRTILRFQISGNSSPWPAWKYTIDDSFLRKWHDIVIVADGKGNANSVGLFVDGKYCNERVGSGIPEIPTTDGSGALRPFTICDKDKTNESASSNYYFTKEDGYIARLRFHNINQMDPLGEKGLAEKINISALGTKHAAEMIQLLLDAEQPTARITATPYVIKTTWSVRNTKNEETPLAAGKPFTNKDIVRNGYSVETTFEAFDGFAFDTALTEEEIIKHIKISLPGEDGNRTILSVPFDESLYRCNAGLSSDGRRLTVKVTFLPCEIPPQEFTYASPAAGRTYREKPRYDKQAVEKYMTVADTKWKKVTKANGTETEEEITLDDQFEQITPDSWYRAESVLTAKGVYLFGRDYDDVPEGQRYSDLDRTYV